MRRHVLCLLEQVVAEADAARAATRKDALIVTKSFLTIVFLRSGGKLYLPEQTNLDPIVGLDSMTRPMSARCSGKTRNQRLRAGRPE